MSQTPKRSVLAVVLARADLERLDALTERERAEEMAASRSRTVRRALRLGMPLLDAELKGRGL